MSLYTKFLKLLMLDGGERYNTMTNQTIRISGNNVNIVGRKIIVDGVDMTDQYSIPENVLKIEIEGKVENLTTDKSVNVRGDVLGNVDAGGSVNAGNIGGYTKAGGSVNADDISGNVEAGGSVNCDDIGGSVNASKVVADTIHNKG